MKLYDNKYCFIKELGEGGFGRVFLAIEKVSGREVAIKQLINVDDKDQEDIIHEIEIISKFNHQNIVTYYHNFWEDGQLFVVMEYCAGGTLRDKINDGNISSSTILRWFQTLTSCLRTIHKMGIMHHDIKPDNILFSKNGTIKISDFGVADKNLGTRSYMSPESLFYGGIAAKDPRIDIYALGVTLLELLTGVNPFSKLSRNEILAKHQGSDFSIQTLPNWQQELILKSINKVPELRFQFMVEFEEALKAKAVPNIFQKEAIKAAELVGHAEKELKRNKWRNALNYLELANTNYPNNVSVLQSFGKYFLRTQQIKKAKENLDKALRLNPRLDIQKELGWINLENKKYPIAMGLLSDHLYRHPSDYQAYNLLVRCYYETGRYEQAMDLSKMLMETNGQLSCFTNNYYISYALQNEGKSAFTRSTLQMHNNPFLDYNYSVLVEKQLSHGLTNRPTLSSKLLFMDFDFNTINENSITFIEGEGNDIELESIKRPIIKFGREKYKVNDFQVAGANTISRRHCVIINSKNNTWLYDLESTGTYLNDERINGKAPISGFNKLRIGQEVFYLNTDRTKLL